MPQIVPTIQINKDNTFIITFKDFYQGFAPLAHINSLTELGNRGHASAMENADILSGEYLTQGPALADLTNGSQAGVVDQLINFILDQPTAASKTYGIGTTKLFRITPTSVSSGGTPSWPQTLANMADGQSLILLKGNIYGFYNKSSGGDILKMPISSEVIDPDWGSTTPATGSGSLQKAPHPSDKKEDLIVFGNGRYAGFYNVTDDELNLTKWDFGNDAEVVDILFHANQWWAAVNYGVTGTNRVQSQIFLLDGSTVSSVIDDEIAVGRQKIGFMFPVNGIVFVAYQDLTFTGGYKIGYISGRRLIPVGHFTGALPTFAQKTLYKNTIIFVSSALIWSIGAVIEDFPYQVSQIADGGHATVGALAAPFGTPMVASTVSTSYRLAKFSGYEVNSTWRSLIVELVFGRNRAYIDNVIVLTNHLGSNARCDLQLEYNQQQGNSGTVKQIKTAGKRLHSFDKLRGKDVEDVNVYLNFANGSASNPVNIRKVIILGHLVQY